MKGKSSSILVLAMVVASLTTAASAQPAPASPAGCTQDCAAWEPVTAIDFSPRHGVLIRNPDGTLTPMDQPWFQSTLIAPGVWQVLSEGDYSYVIQGDKQAITVDSTYGAGNIRAYEQTLTRKPLRFVVNTHEHFDHTADNAYFDRAFMSAYARTRATIPFPSFAGISFPRDYPITVIKEGHVFHLGNRDLEVFDVPNHTMGDIALLDRKARLLFAGDLFSVGTMPINGASSVARFAAILRKLATHRRDFDRIAGGYRIEDAAIVDHCLANAEYILAGHEGVPVSAQSGPPVAQPRPSDQPAPPGAVVYTRHMPHPGDGGQGRGGTPNPDLRRMTYAGCTITYNIRHIES